MTDNSENVENTENVQADINLQSDVISTETSTLNSKIEKENMEVHHHAHHGHEKKTWKNYFWEFFMLFLAVFCGFLAELQLEHYVEGQREKKYVMHLIQDLEKDSVSLSQFSTEIDRRVKRIDSLLQILISDNYSNNGNEMYYFARRLVRSPNYFPSDASILQLKYSGNFRLIKNSILVKQIGSYENQNREFMLTLEEGNEANAKYRELLEFLFDGKEFYKMLDSTNQIIRPSTNPQLITSSRNEINKLVIKLQFLKGGALRNQLLSKRLLYSCINLQKTIREKYNL